MNVYRANLLHAVFTMVCATYIYYTTGDKLIVLLIVVAVMLLSLNNGVQHGVTSQIKAALGVSWLGAILLYRPIDVAFAKMYFSTTSISIAVSLPRKPFII